MVLIRQVNEHNKQTPKFTYYSLLITYYLLLKKKWCTPHLKHRFYLLVNPANNSWICSKSPGTNFDPIT